jgi:hypothetical protein
MGFRSAGSTEQYIYAASAKTPKVDSMSLVLISLLATRSWRIDAMLHQQMAYDVWLATQNSVTQVAFCLPSVIAQVAVETLGMAVRSTTYHTHKLTLVTCACMFTITSCWRSLSTPHQTCRHNRKYCQRYCSSFVSPSDRALAEKRSAHCLMYV